MVDPVYGRDIFPIKPLFFDKKKLSSEEYKNYIYEIEFKKSAKKVRDMSLAGYVHAIAPYLKSVNSEVVQFGFIGEQKVLRAVVKCTIVVSFRTDTLALDLAEDFPCYNDLTFTALADGDVTNVPSSDTLVRTVETRALKRAIARALDISKVDLNDNFVDEEEIGTPIVHNEVSYRKSPQDIAREKQHKLDAEERDAELDDGRNESPKDW